MECTIPCNHVKLFAKAVHCLAKLGSEIYLDCMEKELEMKTVNASRSTFACFTFPKSFFVQYSSQPIYDEDNQLLRCKISVKTFLQVFRSINFIERSVETCDLALSNDHCHLVFTLNCKHTIVKTYQLNFEECESLKAVYTKDFCPNKLTASCKLLLEVLMNFPSSLEEISLTVSPCKVSLTNFTDEEEMGKVMSTDMNLHPEEFDYFQVGFDTSIAFCLKDLRAILSFAEACNSNFNMNFECGGKPLVFSLTEEHVLSAVFVLATIGNGNSNDSVQVNSASVREKRGPSRSNENGANKRKKYNEGVSDMGEMTEDPIDLTRDDSSLNIDTTKQKTDKSLPVSLPKHHNNNTNSAYSNVRDLFFSSNHQAHTGYLNKTILAADSDDDT